MGDILGIDFNQAPKSGQTHPYGVNMLEMLGFTRFDPALQISYDEDGNSVWTLFFLFLFLIYPKADTFAVRGTDNTLVGEVHFVNLVGKDEDGEPVQIIHPEKYISVEMIHQETGETVETWYFFFL